ncbi:olfactory receptor 5V1-like [Lissotriton helveticus]
MDRLEEQLNKAVVRQNATVIEGLLLEIEAKKAETGEVMAEKAAKKEKCYEYNERDVEYNVFAYADDVALITKDPGRALREIEQEAADFGSLSGYSINKGKTQIILNEFTSFSDPRVVKEAVYLGVKVSADLMDLVKLNMEPLLAKVQICDLKHKKGTLCEKESEVVLAKMRSFNKAGRTTVCNSMDMWNQSRVTEFTFMGFCRLGHCQGSLFWVFLIVYMTTLSGNLMIFNIICVDLHLHEMPMYFFLANLSLLDICYTTAIMPKTLANLWAETNTISHDGCLAQLFFFVSCTGAECILLTLMAYDRYVAVCHPLRYMTILNHRVCILIAVSSWAVGILNSLLHTMMTAHLSFCGPREIQHYFCDVPPLLQLSCSDTYTNNVLLFVISMFLGLGPCVCIITSYSRILSAVMKIKSSVGRSKAFSTCSSHLIVVVLFYASGFFIYVHPFLSSSRSTDIVASVFYSIITPMINPMIYCFRNKEVKEALRKVMQKRHCLREALGTRLRVK